VKETVAYCDLDDKDARRPGVAVLRVEIDGTTHIVDVCQVHLTILGRLPSTAAVRGRRGRRAVKRAPAKRAAAKAAPAKRAVGRPAKAVATARPAAAKRAAKATKAAPAKRAVGRPAKSAAAKATARSARAARAAIAGRTPGSRRDQQQRVAAAREWARAQGRAIAGKGRLPAGLLQEFEAATS
jgi:hypothetical protein